MMMFPAMMGIRIARPAIVAGSYDADAQAYITAVEVADGQALETVYRDALNDFVVGCKADGIWAALGTCVIMAGARTISGALKALKGPPPQNNNFVAGDFSRTTGLRGDNATKQLITTLNSNQGVLNSNHYSVNITLTPSLNFKTYIAENENQGHRNWVDRSGLINGVRVRNQSNGFNETSFTGWDGLGYLGASRDNATTYQVYANGTANTITSASGTLGNNRGAVFSRFGVDYTDARMSWYSLGTSINQAQLSARLATLMAVIAGL